MPCSTHKAISRQTRFEPRKSGLGSYILSTKLGCLSSFLSAAAAAAAKLLQSCPTMCDPIDGSSVPGILQARTLEWVAISFSYA